MRTSADPDGALPGMRMPGGSAPHAPGLPAWAWSVAALLLGLAVSVLVANYEYRRLVRDHDAALEVLAMRGQASLAERLRGCELLVRSVQTVFLSTDDVSPAEFHTIFANLRPAEVFPSLQALAFARRTPRADGDHYITEMVAPRAGNEAILGLDINTQPNNLLGALRSRDDNRPALSAPFRLQQQAPDEPRADGVTLRLPIYSAGAPPATVAERRARTIGSMAASFRLSRLIADALPEDTLARFHVVVVDTTGPAPLTLHDSLPGPHADDAVGKRFQRDLHYGGRTWRVAMHPRAGAATPTWPWVTFGGGAIASVLLALLAWSIASTRRRALQLGARMSRDFAESEARFRALNELLPALVVLASREDGRITYANQAARQRFGSDGEALDGIALASVFEDAELATRLAGHEDIRCANAEAQLHAADGGRFWANVSIAGVELGDRPMLLMVATDVSEQRQLTEMLTYQASHDALTDLVNRREFERRVEHALATVAAGGEASALLYIDLDQFKLINDTSGHSAGDQLLVQLASVMREQLRGGDVLARLGGDEFGVLALSGSEEGARLLAERLRVRIDAFTFVWQQRTYAISASIGVVLIDRADATLAELFAQADTACYIAKEEGRNRVHLHTELDDASSRHRGQMDWANRLRWALSEGRMLLYYQQLHPLAPQAAGSHIELLLRLRDEQGQVVMPGAFLPAAERFGLMPLIDRWVIENALANFDRLHPDGAALAMCTINLSGASIEDHLLAERILSLLDQHRVAPGRVCFEITETVAIRSMAQVVRFVERLRDAGCCVALDDFGVGMSSFGYLKNLPVDMIKIDGSFIRDMQHDPMSQAIVRAVTDIGHQRGLTVIAEWVEGPAQIDALRAMGVDYAQGYALHRPEPVRFQPKTLCRLPLV